MLLLMLQTRCHALTAQHSWILHARHFWLKTYEWVVVLLGSARLDIEPEGGL